MQSAKPTSIPIGDLDNEIGRIVFADQSLQFYRNHNTIVFFGKEQVVYSFVPNETIEMPW